MKCLEGTHQKKMKKGIQLEKFFASLEENLNELAIDQKYLYKRYYQQENEEVPSSLKKGGSKLGL